MSCYSPPSSLKIKQGEIAEVEGWRSREHIRANTITNITESGPTCKCGTIMGLVTEKIFPEWIEIKGKVGRVIQSSAGIEFELEAEE